MPTSFLNKEMFPRSALLPRSPIIHLTITINGIYICICHSQFLCLDRSLYFRHWGLNSGLARQALNLLSHSARPIYFWDRVLLCSPGWFQTYTWFSCFSLQSTGITGVLCYYTWLLDPLKCRLNISSSKSPRNPQSQLALPESYHLLRLSSRCAEKWHVWASSEGKWRINPLSFARPELRCSWRPEGRGRAALGGLRVRWLCLAPGLSRYRLKKKKKKKRL
jgi:hypothetical protein